jgi:hypothetical protein
MAKQGPITMDMMNSPTLGQIGNLHVAMEFCHILMKF